MRFFKFLLLSVVLILWSQPFLLAQGDGPRAFLLAPKGVWGINQKWLNLSQNFLPNGNILVKNADLNVNVFPTTLFHTTSIGGKYVQLMFMLNPGSLNGTAPLNPALPVSQIKVDASGLADGVIGFKVGLIGAPALNVSEFAKKQPAFSMMGYFRLWYSGSYDQKNIANMGTNRATYEFGFPMSMPLNNNPKRAIWLETYPAIQIYSKNTEPGFITRADESHEKPLFTLENHLTHNFADKFWAGVDVRYQNGGELELDGVKQDNKINILGGGISAGYQFLPFFSGNATYGTILAGDNEAHSDMLRLSLVFVYVNMKKLKAKAN